MVRSLADRTFQLRSVGRRGGPLHRRPVHRAGGPAAADARAPRPGAPGDPAAVPAWVGTLAIAGKK